MFVGFEFLLRLDEFFQVGVVGVKSTPFGCAVKSRPKVCYITTLRCCLCMVMHSACREQVMLASCSRGIWGALLFVFVLF